MSAETYLGKPPQTVIDWMQNHRGGDVPSGKWGAVISALEAGDIKDGTLNGVTFDDQAVSINTLLSNEIAVYQGNDGEISAFYPGESYGLEYYPGWIVASFNAVVPEYVKYLVDGTQRVFVKATDDDNNERSIVDGDLVYRRAWDKIARRYHYFKIGTVQESGGEQFTYGATNDDYYTISIKDPYSVPARFVVKLDKDGKLVEAIFAGHNMQLQSNYTILDLDSEGSYENAMAATHKTSFTTMCYGQTSNWEHSYVRAFLNGLSNPNAFLRQQYDEPYLKYEYITKHSLLDKLAKSGILPAVCRQVNRNWIAYDDTVKRTIDMFWLPGIDIMKSSLATGFPDLDLDKFKDSIHGMCDVKVTDYDESGPNNCIWRRCWNTWNILGFADSFPKWVRGECIYDDTVVAATGKLEFDYDNIKPVFADVNSNIHAIVPMCSIG